MGVCGINVRSSGSSTPRVLMLGGPVFGSDI